MNGANEIKQSNPLKGRSGWRFRPIDWPVFEKKEKGAPLRWAESDRGETS